jgi:hypothetical protein
MPNSLGAKGQRGLSGTPGDSVRINEKALADGPRTQVQVYAWRFVSKVNPLARMLSMAS